MKPAYQIFCKAATCNKWVYVTIQDGNYICDECHKTIRPVIPVWPEQVTVKDVQ